MRFEFEQLEKRRLFTIPVTGTSPNLILNLTDAPDLSYISNNNDFLELRINGTTLEVRNAAGTLLDSRSATGVVGINIATNAGADFVRMGTAAGAQIPNLPVTVHGGSGDDTIVGGMLNDQLFGDDNNDRIDGKAGRDTIDGGNGFDSGDYGYRVIALNATLDGVANDGTNAGSNSTPGAYNDQGGDNLLRIEAVLGGSGNDSMRGDAAGNWFDGGGGNDTIFGGDGIDTLFGGTNTDIAYGELGNDYFFFQDALGDQFNGGGGSTIAQYDVGLDTPAPNVAAAALTTNALRSLIANELITTDNLQRDDSFGEGAVLTQLNGIQAKINDVAIQTVFLDDSEETEEKIIVVGSAINPNSESEDDYDAVVIRYKADGTLDTDFGDEGFVFTDFSGGEGSIDTFNSVAINRDNQIIAAGSSAKIFGFEPVLYNSEYAIARYNEDGDLDDSFGDDFVPGTQRIDPDEQFSDDRAARLEIQYVFIEGDLYEEEYVLAGTLGPTMEIDLIGSSSSTYDWGLIRVHNWGERDFGFGNGGLARLDTEAQDFATGLAIDGANDDNIWVTGYSRTNTLSRIMVKGYDANGDSIPGAFSVGVNTYASFDFATDAAIDPDSGRLLVVGTSDFGSESTSFGTITAFNIDPESPNVARPELSSAYLYGPEFEDVEFNALTLDGQGHGIAVGRIEQNSGDFYVYRFNTSDLSQFGDPITADFGNIEKSSDDYAMGAVVQEDGRIVVAGVAGDPYAALVRFEAEEVEPPPPPFVDVPLSPLDVQNFVFMYTDETGTHPIPDYLVQRIKALQPDGTFKIVGTPGPDKICVTEKDGLTTALVNGVIQSQSTSQVTGLWIQGLGGDDEICIDSSVNVPATIEGGDGSDTAFGSKQGDKFFGGNGNDFFFGLGGNDVAYGDDGCDVILGGLGNDTIYGGAGRDLLIGGRGKDFIRGGAGEDIIIGGFTLFDDWCAPLIKIIAQWSCSDARSRRLGCLGGNNGGLNAGFFFRTSGLFRTVFDDGDSDNCGGEGDSDWFFCNTNKKSPGCDTSDLGKNEDMSAL